jgi:uncharacterized protein (DUF1015 family)
LIAEKKKEEAVYDFVSEDGIRHRVFIIDDEKQIETIMQEFAQTNDIYIADGHHRAASAVKVGLKRRSENPSYDGTEEFNYFLSVLFADEQLMIMDYNRVVKDLNGYSEETFLQKMEEVCDVTVDTSVNHAPTKKGEFTMYLAGKWYRCGIKEKDLSKDPVEGLDVSILQNVVLTPVLGIEDPRIDKRIDFVG